jgi:hypothetical protein
MAFVSKTQAQIPNYVPSNGLVGWWPFNGNANDESLNGNNGTVNGATLTADRNGNANSAYSFDGQSNFIKTPSNNFPSVSKTISFWMSAEDFNQRGILAYGGSGNCGDSYILHLNMISCSGANKLTMQSHCCVNTFSVQLSYIPLQQWNHIIFSADLFGTKFYINGLLINSTTNYYNTVTNNNDFAIGAIVDYSGHAPFTDYNSNYYHGQLDDIGIWNRALTDQEIQALYNGCSIAPNEIVGNISPEVFIAETYTCNFSPGSTYQWLVTNGVINSGQGTNSVSVSWAGTGLGTISVLETTSSICQGDTISLNVVLIPTGLEEINQSAIKFYPNPANSNMTIDYGNFAMMNNFQLKIQNSLGQQVFQTNISQQTDNLSISTWGGNGIYFVHIIDPQGNTIDIRKIVLQ